MSTGDRVARGSGGIVGLTSARADSKGRAARGAQPRLHSTRAVHGAAAGPASGQLKVSWQVWSPLR